MISPSIADLLVPPSNDEIEALMLAYVQLSTNPVTDWESGAVQKTMVMIEAAILASLVGPGTPPAVQSAMANLLANGYPDSAAGDSLATIAHGWFEVEKNPGAFAVQTVTLACASGPFGPYTFTAGLQEGVASDGVVYVAAGSGTLTNGSSITIDFNARSLGLAKAMITALAQPLAGVTVQSAVIKVVAGVPQFGANPDSDAAVLTAIESRFPDLTAIGTQDRVVKWALAAGTTTTRTRLDPDNALAGGVILTIANATGPVPGGDVTTVAAYVLARQPITDNITVQNAISTSVTPGGTVTVATALEAQVKAAADAAFAAQLGATEIGGTVYLLGLIQAVMDAGAINFANPTLNGSPSDLTLVAAHVPVVASPPSAALTWVPV